MKGIILAGGNGSRLFPITLSISKHLLPIYDKPMIYYPLATLMEAGIKDILIISTPHDINHYEKLLGDGRKIGISISYAVQVKPEGIAQAFIVGEEFIGDDDVALILGDNFFYGSQFQKQLHKASTFINGATIFGYHVPDPERFGVVSFSEDGKVISIEEKPRNPKTNVAVTGLYFFDNKVANFAKKLKKSPRGELEITDINNMYLEARQLSVDIIPEGNFWLDTGTTSSLFLASQLVKNIEETQKIKIGCIEEIAFQKGYITRRDLMGIAKPFEHSEYGQYLFKVAHSQPFRGER